MKHIHVIILVLLASHQTSIAQPVSREMVEIVARNHFKQYYEQPFVVGSVREYYRNTTLCLYKVQMTSGVWCIIPSDMRIRPVLAFGTSAMEESDPPEAFLDLLDWYKKEVDTIINHCGESIPTCTQWQELLDQNRSPLHYSIGDSLLDMVRGTVLAWGQGYNNSGTCSPSYNMACPDENEWTCPFVYTGECNCGHKPVGCGAVAMGQIMWYWQWPRKSCYREYLWEKMLPALYYTTDVDDAMLVAKFLSDCGEAVGMIYCCAGAFTYFSSIASGFRNTFEYKNATFYKYSEWNRFGPAWGDLVKSEIDNGRPVMFYGESFSPITGHYFVVDGYQEDDEFIFCHVNWGHRGNGNCFCRLDNLHEGQDYYNTENEAIVAISPYYNDTLLTAINYSSIPS